eukprot:12154940-Alexandrium_andersonii.AAC.1
MEDPAVTEETVARMIAAQERAAEPPRFGFGCRPPPAEKEEEPDDLSWDPRPTEEQLADLTQRIRAAETIEHVNALRAEVIAVNAVLKN